MQTTTINPKIDESWKQVLAEEFQKDYFIELKKNSTKRKTTI